MVNVEQIRSYCMSKKAVTEHLPFDDNVLVFKVMNKMFLLTGLDSWEKGESAVNLKCNPEYAEELRGEYESIRPGYHMSKKHWNTVDVYMNELPPKFLFELIDHSYDLIVQSLPKKIQEQFHSLQ